MTLNFDRKVRSIKIEKTTGGLNLNQLTQETYTTVINNRTVTQTRRLGEENGLKFYWAIRNYSLKVIAPRNK